MQFLWSPDHTTSGIMAVAPPPVLPVGPDPRRVMLEKQALTLQNMCSTVKRFDESVGAPDFRWFAQEFKTQVQCTGNDFLAALLFEADIVPCTAYPAHAVTSNDLDTIQTLNLPQLRTAARPAIGSEVMHRSR